MHIRGRGREGVHERGEGRGKATNEGGGSKRTKGVTSGVCIHHYCMLPDYCLARA